MAFVGGYGGIGSHPPMVEDLGHVENSVCALGGTQKQVVVLGPLEALPEPAEFFQEASAVDTQVGDVVGRQQKIGRPARLEARLRPVALPIYCVVVRVDEVDFGMLLEKLDHLEESVGC